MIEIKFRAWDEDEGCMYFSDGTLSTYGEKVSFLRFWELVDRFAFPVERFIGTDAQGEPMYLGDRVRIVGDDEDSWKRFDGWHLKDEGEYIVLANNDETDAIPLISFEYRGKPEIVGNIHETPKTVDARFRASAEEKKT